MRDATRCASDVAAMRRGCVTTTRHGGPAAAAADAEDDARSSSSGMSVLLPHPVSPVCAARVAASAVWCLTLRRALAWRA
jgi:hypothetical protein